MTEGLASRRLGLALVCALGVAAFAVWSWPLAGNLSSHTLIREGMAPKAEPSAQTDWGLILANDQNVSLWGAVHNARALAGGDPVSLLWQGQCYPMPGAAALGEHLIEPGILALPWWLVSGDPVAAYNVSLLLEVVIAATGMFLFLHGHTGSLPAAIAFAIAFAFATPRLADLSYHPAVVGVHWIPWVLWSFDRMIQGGTFGAFALFALTLLLSTLVGSYPLIATTLVGGVYGLTTLILRARRGSLERGALVSCVTGTLPALLIAGGILFSYADLQREWILVANPDSKFLIGALDYLPGGLMSAGAAAIAGLVWLLVFRRGTGSEAVLPLVLATAVAFVLTTRVSEWSLYEALAAKIGLLDSVRAPGKAGLAVCFGLQALGAVGWSRCFERIGPGAATALAVLLVAWTAVETSPPRALRGVLGDGARMELREIAPPPDHIEALTASIARHLDPRPVLDLPFGRMVKAPVALLDAAYHGHPTSACYASLVAPTMRAVHALGAHSRSPRGVAELAAAGFGFVIDRPASPSAGLSPTAFPAPARLLSFEKTMAVWALPHPLLVHRDMTLLRLVAKGGATRGAEFAPEPPHELDIEVTNTGSDMWAAPRPIQPLFADVELRDADDKVALRSRARGVLPLALSPAATTTIQLVMPEAPQPGTYKATIRIEGAPHATSEAEFRWADERG